MQFSQPRYSIERLRGHQWTLVCLQSVDSVGAYMRKHTAGKLKVKSAIQDAGAVCQKCPNKAWKCIEEKKRYHLNACWFKEYKWVSKGKRLSMIWGWCSVLLNADGWVFFGRLGVTHHHFVLRFLTNLSGYRKREAANGHAGCSFKRCSEVHFIPKVMTIHWETMTSVMAVFSRWVGRETEPGNELIMRESE